MTEPKCICWVEGYPHGDRHQSECDSYGEGWDDALDDAKPVIEAAFAVVEDMRSGLNKSHPRGAKHLAAYDAAIAARRARVRREVSPGEKADLPASAPGPLDPAAALNHAISESIASTQPKRKKKR